MFLLPSGPCTISATGAYSCLPAVQTSTVIGYNTPTPIPRAGLFGDPQLFVLESRDTDSQTRNFGPVMLQVRDPCVCVYVCTRVWLVVVSSVHVHEVCAWKSGT